MPQELTPALPVTGELSSAEQIKRAFPQFDAARVDAICEEASVQLAVVTAFAVLEEEKRGRR